MIGTTSPAPSPEYPTGFRLAVILISLFLGTFLVAVDTTIVSVAIPKISTEFHTLSDVGWYGSAYLISITALQPAGGTIYKFFNVKLVYLASILVFEGVLLVVFHCPSPLIEHLLILFKRDLRSTPPLQARRYLY